MYEQKYLKYKQKYLELKAKLEGGILDENDKILENEINQKKIMEKYNNDFIINQEKIKLQKKSTSENIIYLQNRKQEINQHINQLKVSIKKKVNTWNPFYDYNKINDNDNYYVKINKSTLIKLESEIKIINNEIILFQKKEKEEANAKKQKELVDREANQQRIREETKNSDDMSSY